LVGPCPGERRRRSPLWKQRRVPAVTNIYKSVPIFTNKPLIWTAIYKCRPVRPASQEPRGGARGALLGHVFVCSTISSRRCRRRRGANAWRRIVQWAPERSCYLRNSNRGNNAPVASPAWPPVPSIRSLPLIRLADRRRGKWALAFRAWIAAAAKLGASS